jgi:hypothetical protein
MLVAMTEYNRAYYSNLIYKLNRVREKMPIHVDVFAREGTIYVIGLDDGFSALFVYTAYLKAKGKGLNAKLLYARYIDESWLPEEVRKLGKAWLTRGLKNGEAETLRGLTITEYILNKWCGVV